MNLVDMRTSGLVDEEVFTQKRREYMIERQAAHERLQDAGKGIGDWVENAHRLFNFAEKAATAFDIAKEKDDMATMRSILAILGSNLLLRDKKLIIAKGKLLSALEEVSSAAQAAQRSARTAKRGHRYRFIAESCNQKKFAPPVVLRSNRWLSVSIGPRRRFSTNL